MEKPLPKVIKHLVLDVDGVLTDGCFTYTVEGKVAKRFGPDDNDAISLIRPYLSICAISGDKRGFGITKKRVEEDMNIPLYQVSTFKRLAWMKERYALEEVVYMGDGIFDAMVFYEVGYAIAPANAFDPIKQYADHVTKACGGSGAVAEACWHLMEKFFHPLDPLHLQPLESG